MDEAHGHPIEKVVFGALEAVVLWSELHVVTAISSVEGVAALTRYYMDKETTQLQLYQHYLSFFLPDGILDFFELVWAETQSLDSRESKKDII